jgi:sugar (pentulose or hexulose) kinase
MSGPAKSRIWMQILADITGKVVKTTENEDAAPLGDAMLAGVACGHYKSYKEAADKNVRIKDIYYPNPELREIYDTLYGVYRNVYDKLKDDYRKISRF